MLRLMPRPLQFAFQSAGPPPARSLSGRLCRDASSPLPPSPDVGEFIRGAAFPIARAGLRRPQMRSAAECSRPAALFRPSDGFSARPGNVAAPCGGGGAFRLRRRTARAELVRSALPGRIVFSPAFSGCRRIHPGRRLSDRPCGIAASADAVRSGMLPPRGPLSPVRRIFGTPRQCRRPVRRGGGIPAPATNRPRGACPVGFAGTHRLLARLLRMSENSSGAPPFRSPVRDCGVR